MGIKRKKRMGDALVDDLEGSEKIRVALPDSPEQLRYNDLDFLEHNTDNYVFICKTLHPYFDAEAMIDIEVLKVGDKTTLTDNKGLGYDAWQVQVKVTYWTEIEKDLVFFRMVVGGDGRQVDNNFVVMNMYVTNPALFSATCAAKTAMNEKKRQEMKASS
eukprot:m.381793 g.381793  ORF g.381793 m.381793 type:complete len:160 (-) comp16717_c0_seq5:1096-1575(-)